MDIVYFIIAILFAIVVSDIIGSIFTKIPQIIIQIIIGGIVSLLPFSNEFDFNPEIFMLVIIKPLIFNEAQRLSLDELKKYSKPILSLSLVLVVVTGAFTSIMVKLIMPEMSLATAFILAAIIIPTNSSVLRSLTENLKFPRHIFHILENESLFNEAVAILMYELALSVSISREFILRTTVFEFIFKIIGGIVIGTLLGLIIVKLRYSIAKSNFENPSMMIVIQLITPFVVYIISEEYLHLSGIMAVIMSGIVHKAEKPVLNLKSTKLQVISNSTWEVVDYTLEGVGAVMLGLILPNAITNILKNDLKILFKLSYISVFVYFAVASLRFLWVFLRTDMFKISNDKKIKDSIVYALSGIHGTVNLIIALLIPVEDNSRNVFFFREDLIFIAALAILISIIVPAIIFPLFFDIKDEIKGEYTFDKVKKAMLEYTVSELVNGSKNKNDYSMIYVKNILEGQLSFLGKESESKLDREEIRKIFGEAHKIQLKAVDELSNQQHINAQVLSFYKAYISNLDKFSIKSKFLKLKLDLIDKKIRRSSKNSNYEEYRKNFIEDLNTVHEYSCDVALSYLHKIIDGSNYKNVSFVIKHYNEKLKGKVNDIDALERSKDVKNYLSKVFSIENTFIEDYLEKGLISESLADELKEQVSYDQLIYMK